jgi:hypothetical protein
MVEIGLGIEPELSAMYYSNSEINLLLSRSKLAAKTTETSQTCP